MRQLLTDRQAARLAALSAIVDTALGNTVQRAGIYPDGCKLGWQSYVDCIPDAHCYELSACFHAALRPNDDFLCLECEPSEAYFGSRQTVQEFVRKALDQFEKIAEPHIDALAESIFINHSAGGQQVRELAVNIEPIDLSELPTEGPMSQSFCEDISTTLTNASLATAQWAILATALGLGPMEARIYQNSGKSGYAGFVAVMPNSNHCELIECFRQSHNLHPCDECTDIESYHCLENDIPIKERVWQATQKFLNQPKTQSAIQQVSHILTSNKSINNSELQMLTSCLSSIDLDAFMSQIMADDAELGAIRD